MGRRIYINIQSPGGPNAFTQVPASLLKITSTAGGKRLGSSSVCAGEGSCVTEDRSTQGAKAIVVRCSRMVTLLFSKLKKKKKNRP